MGCWFLVKGSTVESSHLKDGAGGVVLRAFIWVEAVAILILLNFACIYMYLCTRTLCMDGWMGGWLNEDEASITRALGRCG